MGGAFVPSADYAITGAWTFDGLSRLSGVVAPISGPAGTGAGVAIRGSTYLNTNKPVVYVNEADADSPYWTPVNLDQPDLLSGFCDFRDGLGVALSSTAASTILAGTGLRLFGSGIEETDSGVVVTYATNGPTARLTTSAADGKLVALSFLANGTSNLPMRPNLVAPMVVEIVCQQISAVTLRRFFVGFLGTVADALVSPATGATTTITLVQDDLGGLLFDAGLTAADTLCAISNNNDAASSKTVAATTTGTTVAAAGTSMLFRVEIDAAGTMFAFRNRVLVATVPGAVDITEEFAPVALLASTSSAVKSMDTTRFGTWCHRPNP